MQSSSPSYTGRTLEEGEEELEAQMTEEEVEE